MRDINRRDILKNVPIIGTVGIGMGTVTSTAAGRRRRRSTTHTTIQRATSEQREMIADAVSFTQSEKKAKEQGESLLLDRTLVGEKSDGVNTDDDTTTTKFVVPTEAHDPEQVDTLSEVTGYHAVNVTDGLESILYLDEKAFYGGRPVASEVTSASSVFDFDIPGYSSEEVDTDDVCDKIEISGEDELCLGAVGYSTLKTLATKSIPYLGSAITATCAAKSELCSRWPDIYEDSAGAAPGDQCSGDTVVLYKAKWWNPIKSQLRFFIAPVCEP